MKLRPGEGVKLRATLRLLRCPGEIRHDERCRAFQELGFRTKTGDTSHFVRIARRMLERSETGRFEGESSRR